MRSWDGVRNLDLLDAFSYSGAMLCLASWGSEGGGDGQFDHG